MNVFEKILAANFDELPTSVQERHLVQPLLRARVQSKDGRFSLLTESLAVSSLPHGLVPKLGVKSWRGTGSLQVIYKETDLAEAIGVLLEDLTPSQVTTAKAWQRLGLDLPLYLSPYHDMSHTSEVRYLVRRGRAEQLSACLRGRSSSKVSNLSSQLRAEAQGVAARLPAMSWLMDLAVEPDGSIYLMEANPGLTPDDLKTIHDCELDD